MDRIETERKGASIYLNKEIRLFIEDGDRTFPRDGILRDFDEVNYYVQMLQGAKKDLVIAFLRTTVRRIEPLISNGGGLHR